MSRLIRSGAGLLAAFAVLLSFTASAQYKSKIVLNPDVIPVEYLGETVPLRDYTPDPNAENPIVRPEKLGYHPKHDWKLNPTVNDNALPKGADPVWQQEYPAQKSSQAGIDVNIDGMGYTSLNPADPSVDAGPNHVIQMINGGSGAYFQIYDKAGNILVAQTYFDTYMGFPGGLGDPIVLYDEIADRWMLSEFSSSGNNMYVAISTTSDPTGSYHTFSFNAPSFPDYPKYSIWDNAYLITSNENVPACYAINRADLLSGTATTAQRFSVPSFETIGFQAATPVSLSGTTAPPSGTPGMVMRMRDDAWSGATNDALEIWEFNVDFNNSANTTLTLEHELPISAFDSELCGYTSFACIPQPGTGTTLDPLREVLMNRVYYRNFGTHETIVCCHVTDVDGTDRAGVRWYELRRNGGVGSAWFIYQEGTYSPDSDGRFMCSIAINAFGSIALAYNVSSSSTYPSLRYTGRSALDPLGVMTEPETTIIAGTASNGSNRYGDYNQLNLDPDGQTFWFTGKYNASSQWSTRITSFTISAPGVGCMDAGACNYDASATTDSGLCSYPGDACNDGDATTINDVLQADCSCAGVVIEGCTDPLADNYDPTATVDDGSCTYSCTPVTLTLSTDCWGSEVSWTLTDDLGNTLDSGSGYGNLQTYTADWCLPDGCYNFNIFDSFGDGMSGSTYGTCGIDGDYDVSLADGTVLVQMTVADYGSGESQNFCVALTTVDGCTDPAACNYNPAATNDDGSCEYLTCAGCTNPSACNYDATATIDDGSCDLPDGCTDAGACNYDAAASCDDGSCEYLTCAGCTNPTACNYDATATIDDGSCNLPDGCTDAGACNYDAAAVCDDGSCEYLTCAGCTDPSACNYDATATIDDGTCILPDGCTDAGACNYDAGASCDDGSCEYLTCAGCTDAAACNYDAAASIDDGSCEYTSCSDCYGDLNNDGQIGVSDLLIVLGDFGCTGVCEADLTADDEVGTSDVLALLGIFGTLCP